MAEPANNDINTATAILFILSSRQRLRFAQYGTAVPKRQDGTGHGPPGSRDTITLNFFGAENNRPMSARFKR
jgi:hypothetical protein